MSFFRGKACQILLLTVPLEFPDTLRWGERFLDALTIHAPFDCEPDECVWTGRPDRKDGSAWGVTVLHEKDAPPAVGDTVRIVGRTAEFTAKILYVFNSRRTRVWCLTTPTSLATATGVGARKGSG